MLSIKPKTLSLSIALTLGAISGIASADSANGILTMNLDAAALATLNGGMNADGGRYIYVEEFFNQSYNTVPALFGAGAPDPTPGTGMVSSLGMQFVVNPSSIAQLAGQRLHQATTFNYTGTPTVGTGQIGLSGAIRIKDITGGTTIMQELSLYYDANRINAGGFGGSGWTLKTTIPGFGDSILFDLKNVTTSTVGGNLALTGDLIFGNGIWGQLYALNSAAQAQIVGNVNLQPVAAPTPTPTPPPGPGVNGTTGAQSIPTLSEWGMIILSGLLVAFGARRSQKIIDKK